MSETDQKTEKPRGGCTGCAFEYQLSVARSGDHKGELVVRKHNSRVGPGLCSGAQKPPKAEQENEGIDPGCCDDASTPDVPQIGPGHCTQGKCEGCCGCSQECTTDPCGQPDVVAVTPLTGTVLDVMTPDQRTKALAVSQVVYEAHAADVVAVAPGGVPVSAPDGRTPEQQAEIERRMADPVGTALASLPTAAPQPYTFQSPMTPEEAGLPTAPDPFTAPAPASDIPEKTVTVSGQPEPDRDRWGRYLIHGQAHTRATTFAKLGANTKAIEAWNERNVIVGLTRRPDLLMLAEGKEVKRDKGDLNSIAQQAKDAAGSKVAANFGTGYHSFSERIDAGQMTLDQVPERYRGRVQQYTDTVRAWGLTTRSEWIERTTAVRADQVSAPLPVAGTLDRILQLPDGSLVIGDLKTGADLSYGEMEIEVQLAVYAHGVNTYGLFDWNTKQWQAARDFGMSGQFVRTDIALVIHLPADGDGCTVYVADIERGWEDAQKLGQLQASLKTKNRFRLLTRQDLAPAQPAPQAPCPSHYETVLDSHGTPRRARCDGPMGHGGVHHSEQYKVAWEPALGGPAPAEPSPVIMQAQQEWDLAVSCFSRAVSQEQLAELYQFAMDSGKFTAQQLGTLAAVGQERLSQLALRT